MLKGAHITVFWLKRITKLLLANASLPDCVVSFPRHKFSVIYNKKSPVCPNSGRTNFAANDSDVVLFSSCRWRGQRSNMASGRGGNPQCVRLQHGCVCVCEEPFQTQSQGWGVRQRWHDYGHERERGRGHRRGTEEEVCKNEGKAQLAATPNWTEQVSS